jgi:hypothetical protein
MSLSLFKTRRSTIITMVVLAMLLTMASVAFAQETEPVAIELPIDEMFGYLGTWITTFGPIVLFLGMIPVALALLNYVVGIIRKAFSGGKSS